MSTILSRLSRVLAPFLAVGALLLAMGGNWSTTPRVLAAGPARGGARGSPTSPPATTKSTGSAGSGDAAKPRAPSGSVTPAAPHARGQLVGKININTAGPDSLVLLPSIGPAKADRIVSWRKRNHGFKRIADLRRVRGIGYRTFKRLAPFLDVQGETTLARR